MKWIVDRERAGKTVYTFGKLVLHKGIKITKHEDNRITNKKGKKKEQKCKRSHCRRNAYKSKVKSLVKKILIIILQ